MSIPVGCVPATWKLFQLQWLPPDVAPGVGSPQMNKFEQVSDHHQVSLVGDVPGLVSGEGGREGVGVGELYICHG